MTLQKVAKLAGVSVSTASKALSDGKDVSEETKMLVERAAEQLGYFSGVKKRRFENRRHSSVTVGIICPEIISVYYSEQVTAICRKINENGGKASVFITEFEKERLISIFERCVAGNEVDALITIDGDSDFGGISLPIPLVYIGGQHVTEVSSVYFDLEDMIKKAVEYLADLGHEKIGFAGEPLTLSKQKKFSEAMKKTFGAVCDRYLFCGEGRFEASGQAAASSFLALEKEDRPTAVLCAYDEVAYGFMQVLRENGISVPEDVSIVGFNDIPTSKYLATPLTSVRIDMEKMAQKAVELVKELVSEKKTTIRCEKGEFEIMKRETVKSLKK